MSENGEEEQDRRSARPTDMIARVGAVAMADNAASPTPCFAPKPWLASEEPLRACLDSDCPNRGARLPHDWRRTSAAVGSSAGRNPQVCEIAGRPDVDPKTDAPCHRRGFHLRKRKLFSPVDRHSEPPVVNFDLQ